MPSSKITAAQLAEIAAWVSQDPANRGRTLVARQFGLTENEARGALTKIKGTEADPKPLVSSSPTGPAATPDEIAAANRRAEKAEAAARLYKKEADEANRRVLSAQEAEAWADRIVDQFSETLSDLSGFQVTHPPLNLPVDKTGQPEEAVIVLSDTHIGKLIRPEHTLGFGYYNPQIYLDRMQFVVETVARLLRDNVANPVTKLHVWLLGDLIEGMLSHAEELPNRMLVVDQVALATWSFYQAIAQISRGVAQVEVRGLGGNHARWPNQKKVPTAGRHSNFDMIVLGQLEALFAHSGPSNVKMILGESAFDIVDVAGWRFKLGHGDHLKGGDKAVGIPAHSIGREMNATTQRFAAHGQRAPDYYVVGDKHRAMVVPTATGRYLVNGAFFADDEYAMSANFLPCRPFQIFMGVHPKFGRSWSYDLALEAAPPGSGRFQLPDRLQRVVDRYSN